MLAEQIASQDRARATDSRVFFAKYCANAGRVSSSITGHEDIAERRPTGRMQETFRLAGKCVSAMLGFLINL